MIHPQDLLDLGARTMTWNKTPKSEGWNEYYFPLNAKDADEDEGMYLSMPYLGMTVGAPGPAGRPEQIVQLRSFSTILELPHITTLNDFLEMYRLLTGVTLCHKPDTGEPIEEWLQSNYGPHVNARALGEIKKLKAELDELTLSRTNAYIRHQQDKQRLIDMTSTITEAAELLATWTEKL